LDVILDESMQALIVELPVAPFVKAALLGEQNGLRVLLEEVIAYEKLTIPIHNTNSDWSQYYVEAIRWSRSLDESDE
ncbi:diguanylate phosphodiesterase, partial [Brevibacillus sp. SIMBA_076]